MPLQRKPPPILEPLEGRRKRLEPTTPQLAIKALRSDIVSMQNLIDNVANRSLLSYNMRKVESDLLSFSQASSTEEGAHEALPKLLTYAHNKATELAGTFGVDTMEGAPAPTLLHPLLEIISKRCEKYVPPVDEAPVPNFGPGSKKSSMANETKAGAAAKFANSRESTPVDPFAPRVSSQSPDRELSPIVQTTGIPAPSDDTCPRPTIKPLSAGAMSQLQSLGISFSAEEPLDIDLILTRLSHSARQVNAANQQLDMRLKVSSDATNLRVTQLQTELAALHDKLHQKDAELQDLRRLNNASRFSPNASRALTTSRDEPMSFEVERQYQRDLGKSASRIRELELAYSSLQEAGADDRRRVTELGHEVAKLGDQIQTLKRALAKSQKENEEVTEMYRGVSQARAEEGRLSLIAVKQLEKQTELLEEQCKAKEQEVGLLNENLTAVVNVYADQCNRVDALARELQYCKEELDDYAKSYCHADVELLESTQHLFLEAAQKCDAQEADMTLLKQQHEDFEMQRNLYQSERQALIERIKSSSEWKAIGTRVPEEQKALALRLVTLLAESEKKENAMAAAHSDRLEMFRNRAENEVESRASRRKADHNIVASEVMTSFQTKRIMRDRRKQKDVDHAKTQPKLSDVKNDYLEEARKKLISPENYMYDRFPPDD